ncbi:MAG: hypothetical protein PHR16_00400 [Methylovulum sp.]|nr:hypothetical protein [Methylovulum sp.]
MKLSYSLLILAASLSAAAGADANIAERYTLPPSKVYIESCGREALLLHPGVFEKQQILHRHGAFSVRHEIAARDGSEWLVLCDLATGSISREQMLVDDVF